MTPDPTPSPLSTELFARFVSRSESGEEVDFESFCREHPQEQEELRVLNRNWERVEAVLDRLGKTGTFRGRLERSYGPDADPGVSLRDAEEASSDPTSTVLERLSDRKGVFGRYDLRGEIGRGGQGAVLRVWDEDLRRNLAMKIILGRAAPSPAGSSPDVESITIGRFLEEAQVTAQLDHPGVVPVHELGLDMRGRVYFTMKLVKGRSLKAIIDLVHEKAEGWTLTRALGVMLKVCEAMSYAHSKGVIHRDLKPGNVLVGKFGEAYVMDWGLARLSDGEDRKDIRIRPAVMTTVVHSVRHDESTAPDSPLMTMDGDVVGTPAYMSPEQAMGDLDAMGPHSDVYSAGAMLYHLMSGRIPYVTPGARINNYAIWSRVQEGPPRPVQELAPDAPPELIAICEKAMAREPGERYADMAGLAEELHAFLEHRVVQAYKTGAVVEFKKWVQRNRGMAAAIVAAIVLALAGLSGTSYVQASMNQRLSRQKTVTEKVNAFLNDDLLSRSAEELVQLGKGQEIRELVAAASRRLDEASRPGGRFENEPLVEASIRHSLGMTLKYLQQYDAAQAELERAESLYATVQGPQAPLTQQVRDDLKYLRDGLQRLREGEAERLASLESSRRLRGEADIETVRRLHNVAEFYSEWGQYDAAEKLYEEVLEIREHQDDPDGEVILMCMYNLACLYADQGRREESEDLFRRTAEIRTRILGENHRDTLVTRLGLANLLSDQGRFDESLPIYGEVLEIQEAHLGPRDRHTLLTMCDYASAIVESGTESPDDLELALELAGQACDAYASAGHGRLEREEHVATLDTLAQVHFRLGDAQAAVRSLEEALSLLPAGASRLRDEVEAHLELFRR